MKDFLKVMKALSEPSRVKILKLLQSEKLRVGELKDSLRLAQPTISKHLKILEEAGLVCLTKDCLWVYYRLSHGEGNPYASSILGSLRHWLGGSPEIETLVQNIPAVRKRK